MRQTQLFTKTQKETPSNEESRNAQLLIRAGYVHKEMAGAYQLLPLGLRVVEKIKQIVREEMNAIEGQELLATTLQRKDLWERTARWSDETVDVWFKGNLKAGGEVGFGWSHEEPLTDMMRNHISSYKDLPKMIYQFQNKLRNELRAKSGIMRGREFIMKDAYSFADTEEQHEAMYEAQKGAYTKIFERLGLGEDTFITFAAGGAFTQFSHEFQTVCEAGEDVTYINKEKRIAINEEVLEQTDLVELGVARDELEKVKTAEVGNIFNFGRHKAEDVGLLYKNETGESVPAWMGSYGIGITRTMGVIVEKFADEHGIVWPEAVAPFGVHLIGFGDAIGEADALYAELLQRGIEVLYDDRDARPGEKFADSDLIGIPLRVVVSPKSLEQGGVEVKKRTDKEAKVISRDKLFSLLK